MKRELIVIFTAVGFIMGSTNVYYYYFIYKTFSMVHLFYSITIGNFLAIILSFLYFKHEQKLKTINNTIIISLFLLALADSIVYVSMIAHNVLYAYISTIIFALAWILLWSSNEYYLMKLNGFKDRAKIVGNRLFIQNITAATTAYIMGKLLVDPMITLKVSFTMKIIFAIILSVLLPHISIDEYDVITPKTTLNWLTKKSLVVVAVLLLTNFAAMLFSSSRSAFINEEFGESFIGLFVALGFLAQITTSRTVTAWVTKHNNLLKRAGVLLFFLGAGFHFTNNDIIMAITIIFATALFTIITLAQRHLIFRYSHHTNTRSIIVFGRYVGAVTRSLVSTVIFLGIVTPIGVFQYIGTFLIALAIINVILWYFYERA